MALAAGTLWDVRGFSPGFGSFGHSTQSGAGSTQLGPREAKRARPSHSKCTPTTLEEYSANQGISGSQFESPLRTAATLWHRRPRGYMPPPRAALGSTPALAFRVVGHGRSSASSTQVQGWGGSRKKGPASPGTSVAAGACYLTDACHSLSSGPYVCSSLCVCAVVFTRPPGGEHLGCCA